MSRATEPVVVRGRWWERLIPRDLLSKAKRGAEIAEAEDLERAEGRAA